MTRRGCIAAAAVVAVLNARTALAHEAHEAAAAVPSSWDIAVLLVLVAAGAMYLLGTVRLHRRGARVRNVERVAFWIGWIAMFTAVAPPMDAAAAAGSIRAISGRLLGAT